MSDATKSNSPETLITRERVHALPEWVLLLTGLLATTFATADHAAKHTLRVVNAFRIARDNPRAIEVLHRLDIDLRTALVTALNDFYAVQRAVMSRLHRRVASESENVRNMVHKVGDVTSHVLVRLSATVLLYEKLGGVPRARFNVREEHRILYAIGRDFSLLRPLSRALLTALAGELSGDAAACVRDCLREHTSETRSWEAVPSPDVEPWPVNLHRERMPGFVDSGERSFDIPPFVVHSRNYSEAVEVDNIQTLCEMMGPGLRMIEAACAASSNNN